MAFNVFHRLAHLGHLYMSVGFSNANAHFILNAGVIISWDLYGSIPACGSVSIGAYNAALTATISGGGGTFSSREGIQHSCHFCPIGWNFETADTFFDRPGTWTMGGASPSPRPLLSALACRVW